MERNLILDDWPAIIRNSVESLIFDDWSAIIRNSVESLIFVHPALALSI